MTMRWVLVAFAVIWSLIVLATVLAVRARRHQRPPPTSHRRHGREPDRFDRLHRQLAHYRASGALPRWDP
jgi:hypothetical protein